MKAYDKFMACVLANSRSQVWEEAKSEWQQTDYLDGQDSVCICGKPHIVYVVVYTNQYTGATINVGSECVSNFDDPSRVYQYKMAKKALQQQRKEEQSKAMIEEEERAAQIKAQNAAKREADRWRKQTLSNGNIFS